MKSKTDYMKIILTGFIDHTMKLDKYYFDQYKKSGQPAGQFFDGLIEEVQQLQNILTESYSLTGEDPQTSKKNIWIPMHIIHTGFGGKLSAQNIGVIALAAYRAIEQAKKDEIRKLQRN